MAITEKLFGHTRSGEPVTEYTLTNSRGMTVKLLSYAAAIRSIVVPDRDGNPVDVALGYDTVAEYEDDLCHFGKVVGRYANRLRNSRFSIDGITYHLDPNEGPNHLHGSFLYDVYDSELDGNCVVFSRVSRSSEEDYPGNLSVRITYSITERNELVLDYSATTDRATVCNLTNHVYFNLNGHKSGSCLDTELKLWASHFTEADGQALTTGSILPVQDTPFDFRAPKPLKQDIGSIHPMMLAAKGFDLNFCLDNPDLESASARAYAPESGIVLTLYATQPGLQLYTGNYVGIDKPVPGKDGAEYHPRDGFCLETQHFPCSPDFAYFPTTLLRPKQEYNYTTVYRFSTK